MKKGNSNKKEEIYEDVLKEEPRSIESQDYTKWEKRLHKSIGFIELEEHHEVLLEPNKKDNQWGGVKLASTPLSSEIHYDVALGEGAGFTCKSQEHAEILSFVLQINERLKRIEDKISKWQSQKP